MPSESLVPPEVLDEAIEAAANASAESEGFDGPNDGDRAEVRDAVEAAAPVIFEAGRAVGIGYEGSQAEKFVAAQESAFQVGQAAERARTSSSEEN